ncbi:hypothetical protein BS47DRAFT_1347048 [Hydnum rufescens UP504]|uniref:Uncharacterized protein n=1 Tax=Hydnum rufescens UP504 TaxID=1448309 RepID=A0A9P6AT21_9AGAM|nr:hypothetical protein BS47DRAFT_1347048 [Hydnum rufescens UP504]
MYHDFTDPLHPIRSATFRSLARYSVSHEDFEIVQRHVFRSLDYEIYNTTPHAYFQEIFDALPSVRSLIRFSDSWAQVMDLAWNMMHSAMLGMPRDFTL